MVVLSDPQNRRRSKSGLIGELDEVQDHHQRQHVQVNFAADSEAIFFCDGAMESGDEFGGFIDIFEADLVCFDVHGGGPGWRGVLGGGLLN